MSLTFEPPSVLVVQRPQIIQHHLELLDRQIAEHLTVNLVGLVEIELIELDPQTLWMPGIHPEAQRISGNETSFDDVLHQCPTFAGCLRLPALTPPLAVIRGRGAFSHESGFDRESTVHRDKASCMTDDAYTESRPRHTCTTDAFVPCAGCAAQWATERIVAYMNDEADSMGTRMEPIAAYIRGMVKDVRALGYYGAKEGDTP